MSRVPKIYIKADENLTANRSNIHWRVREAKMMKYFVVLCLCLTVGVVLAQDQETTTDRRVERDLNIPEMPNMGGFPTDVMSDMAHKFAEGAKNVFNGMKDMIPNGDSVGMAPARRRRSPQQNTQPPQPPKMQG